MRKLVACLALALGGCVSAGPPEGTAFVEVYSGSGFSGFNRTVIYANDSFLVESAGPGDQNRRTSRSQGPDGVYHRVAALVAAEGPKVRRQMTGEDDLGACLDYGSDLVRAEPAVGGFDQVAASCPEPALLAFIQRVLGAIPEP